MHFQAAAHLLELGLAPQDFEVLAEEYDLLSVLDGVLHDPESCGEDPAHLEQVFRGPVAWLPGAIPYGNLWHAVRVGAAARSLRLCPSCFPKNQP